MIEFLALLPAFVLGWIVVHLLAPVNGRGLRRWLVEISLGIGLGAGITSTIYFLVLWAGAGSRISVGVSEAVLLIAAGALLYRRKPAHEPDPARSSVATAGNPPWIWGLRIATMVALCFFALDYSEGVTADPAGQYDAAAIWNVRARYLAGGPQTWRYAVSDKTGTNHPGYPLLTSGFVARTWVVLGDMPASVPATVGLMYTLGTLGLLCGAVMTLGNESLGLLAMLILLASEGFVSQASAQYADVPLSFYILAASSVLALAAARDWPPRLIVLAGLFAGFAAWTKNEGLLFLLFVCIAAWWRGSLRALKWIAAGAAPLLVLTLVFKFALVDGRETMFPNSAGAALKMVADSSRWVEIIKSFARNFFELGFLSAHPLLLLAVLAWAFGFASNGAYKSAVRSRFWLLVAPLGLLAADFSIYLITANDLKWHLSTSNNRVIVQVWPAMLFAFFLMLRPPVGVQPPLEPHRIDRKQKNKRSASERAHNPSSARL